MNLDKQIANERRARFLAIIMAGVLGVVFFLGVFGIVNSAVLVSSTGKFLVNYAKNMTAVTCVQSMNALTTLENTLSTAGKETLVFTAAASSRAMEMITFTGELMQSLISALGDTRKFIVNTYEGARKAIYEATRYVVDIIKELSPKILEMVSKAMERVMELVKDVYELLEFLTRKGILPVLLGLSTLNDTLKVSIETFTKEGLPMIIGAMQTLGIVGSITEIGTTPIAMFTVLVGLGVGGFNKFSKIVTDSTVITDIIEGVVGALGDISVSLEGLTFDFCDTILGFIRPVLTLVSIPGVSQCSEQFIKVGIWWMTNGIFCQSTTVVSDITDCILGEKGNVTILPAFEINFSASSIIDLAGGLNFPSLGFPLDELLGSVTGAVYSLIDSLPGVVLGWGEVSLRTFIGPLDTLINTIFTDVKNAVRATTTRALQASLLPTSFNGYVPTPLPIVLAYIIFRVMTKIATKLVEFVSQAYVTAANLITSWAGCIPQFCLPCFDPCDIVDWTGFIPCDLDEICPGCTPTWCLDDILPISLSTLAGYLATAIEAIGSVIANVNSIVQTIVGSTTTFNLPTSLNNDIDALIDNAFNTITGLYNSFNFYAYLS